MKNGTEEAFFYNALNVLCEGSYNRLKKITKGHGSWQTAWTKTKNPKNIDPETEWLKLEKLGIKLLTLKDDGYPSLLKEIPLPPYGIYLIGDLPEETKTKIAIVGTRKSSEDGKETARFFATKLGEADCVIVSGLAFGIDAAAHAGCIDSKAGAIAVLATGLQELTPRSNERLARKIIDSGGAIVSEKPLGSPVYADNFLERNRIISGLSHGTLIIEAPERSGSLATARFAMEQNRNVFVVPGPINHVNFVGSHKLIRDGAELVSKPEEILESFNLTPSKERPMLAFETSEEKIIFEIIKNADEILTVDKIIESSNLEIRLINQSLTILIVKGVIKETGEGYTLK
jgi:DNA processing protein